MGRRFGLWVALVGLALAALLPASRAQGEPEALTIGATELGLVWVNSAEEPRSDARIQRAVGAGAKLDRLVLYWSNIEPSPGSFDWSRADRVLRDNERNGLGTLAVLLGVPAHARTVTPDDRADPPMPPVGGGPLRWESGAQGPETFCADQYPPRGLYDPIFSDGSDNPGGPGAEKQANGSNLWARFVQETVRRYRPGGAAGLNVRYWEIWNEQDLCQFWRGTPQEYARMLKVAYLVIHQSDPAATVMWGGLAHFEQPSFLSTLVNTLRADPMATAHNGFFDAAASHQYSTVTHGYNYTRSIQNALRNTPWSSKPIWITESGVPICGDYPGPSCPSPYRANPDEQASYVWQNIAYTRLANNGGPIFHFQLHDDAGNQCVPSPPADGFGLFRNEPGSPCTPSDGSPRLAHRAYQLAAQYLTNTEFLWGDIQDGVARRMAFYDPVTEERRLLVWAIGGSDAVARVPAAGNSTRRLSLDGSETTLTPVNGEYAISVPRATNRSQPPPLDYVYTIGGKPYLLIERDIRPPTTSFAELDPVSAPVFEVAWTVSDLGSGIASGTVTLWVQQGDGAWQPWLTGQAATGSAEYAGSAGQRYRFAATAADRAGNSVTSPVAAVETLVSDGTQTARVSGRVFDMALGEAGWAHIAIGTSGGFADAAGNFSFPVPLGRWDVAVNGTTIIKGQLVLADTALTLFLPPTSNPVVNGEFENGLTGWTTGGTSPLALEESENTRDHALHLATAFVPSPGVPGEEGSAGGNSTLSQATIRVPTGAPKLLLVYKVESGETAPGHDKFEIIVAQDGQPAYYAHVQETGSDWRYLSLDLSEYAGETITLLFNVYETSPNRRTSAWIDHIAIGQSPVLDEPHSFYLPLVGR